MSSNKFKISAEAFNEDSLKTLNNNPIIDRVHIGCIEYNHEAIQKGKKINKAVVHIVSNTIFSKESILDKLQENNITKILLLTGNPTTYPQKNNFEELIKYFSDHLDVYVGAYPTGYFFTQNKKHLTIQLDYIKRKIDSGAKELYLQSNHNINKLFNFIDLIKKENIQVPINYDISPGINFSKDYRVIFNVISSSDMEFNIKNLDYLCRKLNTNTQKSIKTLKKIIKNNYLRKEDGIYISTSDNDIIPFLNKITLLKP